MIKSALLAALAAVTLIGAMPHARAEILCNRDAEITPVQPKFDNDDDCLGSVKLQGISFKCTDPANYDALMRQFLDEIITNGRARCKEYCRLRASSCYGHFDEPTHCGWAVPRNEVVHVGAVSPCSDHCEGKAFIYCSIYHASYLRVEEKQYGDFKPNCFCDHHK